MQQRKLSLTRIGAVIAVCAIAGAAAGIAGSAAAPAGKAKKSNAIRRAGGPGPGFGPRRGPPVHEDAVVLNRADTAFITATEDSGKVKSVSGDQLTITEGTKTVTYKDVTLTIPSGATIRRNDASAQLSDLQAGDFVHVSQSSDGTFVFAEDATHQAAERARRGPGPGGPPPGP